MTAHTDRPVTITISDRGVHIRWALYLLASHTAVAVVSWSAVLLSR